MLTVREETSNKELLSLHRKALTELSKLNLVNLRVNVEFKIRSKQAGNGCDITVFNVEAGNCTFNFYNFTSYKQNQENLERVISVIKLDSFHEIEHTHFNH